jgi:hypothetical protein
VAGALSDLRLSLAPSPPSEKELSRVSSKLPVLMHGIVLSALPADLARVLVVLAIWAGAAAIAAGLTVFSSVLESAPDPP